MRQSNAQGGEQQEKVSEALNGRNNGIEVLLICLRGQTRFRLAMILTNPRAIDDRMATANK